MISRIVISFILVITLSCDAILFSDSPDIENPLTTFDDFYTHVDESFSFFEYIPHDFDSAYVVNRSILESNPTENQLIAALQEMITIMEDGHTDVFLNDRALSYTGWYDQFPLNQLPTIENYFQSYEQVNTALEYGIITGGTIGYIKINTFSGNITTANYEQIDPILEQLSNVDGIVIDVRSNGGGNSNNADLIISRFNDESRLAFRARRKSGPARNEFGSWVNINTAISSGNRFLKPVFVLTNRRSFSSTEWFVSGMRTIPHVSIVGDTTGGGSGNPLFKEIVNGWSMRVSNTQKELPEGRDFQYTGIYPDIAVWISQTDSLNGIDTILERAINLINE